MEGFARLVALNAMCIALTGCDSLYGVRHTAVLDSNLTEACVRETIDTVAGAARILSPRTADRFEFFYVVASVHGAVVVRVDHDGRSDGKPVFRQYYQFLNVQPTGAEVMTVLPVMKAVEEQITGRCGAVELPGRLRESCGGDFCGSLLTTAPLDSVAQ